MAPRTQVTNYPLDFDIPKFAAKVNAFGGPAKGCRFAVRIMIRTPAAGTNYLSILDYSQSIGDFMYVCDAVEFPGRSFDVNQIRYYGPTQELPNNVKYGPCNLSLICNNNSLERQFFDDWQEIINPSNQFNFNYPDNYYCDVEIFQFSEYGVGRDSSISSYPQVIYNYKLYKCWPSFVAPQQVTWADNSDILRLQVSLTYKYWDRPGNNTYINSYVAQPAQTALSPAAQILTSITSK